MNEKTENVSSFVLLEREAGFPQWVAEYQRAATNSLVVAHAPGETDQELYGRVCRRLAESSAELRSAIVACSSSVEPSLLHTRERVCRELLAAMGERGELVLAHNVHGSEDSKHAIFDLAGALCEGLSGTSRVVRVRFTNGRPESGIMPSLPSGSDSERHRVAAAAMAEI